MNIKLKEVTLPDFGTPEETPFIPESIYAERCKTAYQRAGADWLLVYADREHTANINYLSAFDPRFEEALLVISPRGEHFLVVGNECVDYAPINKINAKIVLYQSFGLLGQDRSKAPRLDDVLRDIGIKKGDSAALIGWKYMEENEKIPGSTNLYVPAFIVDCLAQLTGTPVIDATSVLMHPTQGMRAVNEVEQIAAFEWGAARASDAINRVVRGARIGMTEYEAMANMKYMGEPMTCHPMFSAGKDVIVGLSSPTSKKIEKGDGVTTAVGYWGGLSCRAGVMDDVDEAFLNRYAIPYYKAIATWYQSMKVGTVGGELFDRIEALLSEGGIGQLLNPGHLTHVDEWMNTPIRLGSNEVIRSGMSIQCDIIPTKLPIGKALNCEDSVVIADENLRSELQQKYPEVWARIKARQDFVRNEIGIDISDDLLPLSNNAAYFAPFWLAPDKVFVVD